MNVNEIRRAVNARPFRPLMFHLDNGEKRLVNHPEIIVTEVMVITVDDAGLPVYFSPEAITAIRHARSTDRRRTKRGATRR